MLGLVRLPWHMRCHWRGLSTVRKGRGHWDSVGNRRQFLEQFARERGITDASGWRSVSCKDIEQGGGSGLLNKYKGSLLAALQDVFPERKFEPHACRKSVPQGYWKDRANQRAFMDMIRAEKGIKTAEDWKAVRKVDVIAMGGSGILNLHNGSLLDTLMDLYPEEQLEAHECRSAMPQGYWSSRANRRAFLDRFADQRGISSPEEWRTVVTSDLVAMGGARVLRLFPSLVDLLQDSYPEHAEEWKKQYAVRPSVPESYWDKEENVREFLAHTAKELGVQQPSDWARVSRQQLNELGGRGLLRRRTLAEVLAVAYPNEKWDSATLAMVSSNSKRSTQRLMRESLRGIFASVYTQHTASQAAM